MTKDVDLLHYIPLFMQEYKEIAAALNAENPEFVSVWDGTGRVLDNEFITTADEYGIGRFENLLGILPYAEDTIESRRARVSARWFTFLPYTLARLVEKLNTVCGEGNFALSYDFEAGYALTVVTSIEMFGIIDELESVLNSWVPANINLVSVNEIICESSGNWGAGGGTVYAEDILISQDGDIDNDITAMALQGGGVVETGIFTITQDFQSTFQIDGSAYSAGGLSVGEMIEIEANTN